MSSSLSHYPGVLRRLANCRNVVPVLILATLMLGFFDRPALFHDEIINSYKAQAGIIFDYANRPLFYFTNYAAVRVLGGHPLGPSFAILLITFLGGWLTYAHLTRLFGFSAGVAGVSAYAWLGWVYQTGVGIMAHMLPAAFTIFALYLYQSRRVEEMDNWRKAAVSAALLCALASHPTAATLVVAFYLVVGISLARARAKQRITTGEFIRHGLSWAGLALLLPLLIEAAYWFSGRNLTYIGSWLASLERTGSDRFSGYFQPFGYYFDLMLGRYYLLLLILAGVTIYHLARRRRSSQRLQIPGSDSVWQAIELCLHALLALLLISTHLWKFERVAATFAPFVSMALVAAIYTLTVGPGRSKIVMDATVAIVVFAFSLNFFIEVQGKEREGFSDRRMVYSSFMELLRTTDSDEIAYIGPKEAMRMPVYPAVAAGKRLRHMGARPEAVDASGVFAKLLDRGYRHVIAQSAGEGRDFASVESDAISIQKIGVYRNNGYTYELLTLASKSSETQSSVTNSVVAQLADSLDVSVRYDRLAQVQGKTERQIYIEVLGGNIGEAEVASTDAFLNYGFNPHRGMVNSDGVRLRFSSNTFKPVDVLIRDQLASPPFKNSDGTSSIYLRQRSD